MHHVVATEIVVSAGISLFAGGTELTAITKSSIRKTNATTGPMHFSTELALARQTLLGTIVVSVNTVTMAMTATRKKS